MALEILDYPFMRSALLVGVILGTLFSLMGIFVVTKGMSFFSDFIAHAAILGGGLALLIGADSSMFLIPFSLALALAVWAVWHLLPLSRDTVLGAFYGGAVAAGIILISVLHLGQQGLVRFLLGDILLIRDTDIYLALGLLVAFCVFSALTYRRLMKATLLPEISRAEGIRVRRYDLALVAFLAVSIAISIKLIGALLANAMVVIPAASAKALSRSFRQFAIAAPIIGVGSFTGGLLASFSLNLPSGPAIIACAFAIFLACMAIRLLRGN